MRKDEILSKARHEYTRSQEDERELGIKQKSGFWSAFSGLMLCSVISVILKLKGGVDPIAQTICWLVFTGMMSTNFTIKAIETKAKEDRGWAILTCMFFIAVAIIFFMRLFQII